MKTLPRRIHLVGIGGIGLSAIARVLVGRGHIVSGSDMRASERTREMEALGIAVNIGHDAQAIADATVVLASSAIPETNLEIVAAKGRGIPVLVRRQMLDALVGDLRCLAVAGTHGKTTTSSMLAVVWEALGLDPTFIVGGIIQDLGTNARAGSGKDFIIEADEYDRAFHGLSPDIAIITNVEMDHPDCYPDMASMREAFEVFCVNVEPGGVIIACADSPELARVLQDAEPAAEIVTYGISPSADYVVDERTAAREGTHFSVRHGSGTWCECELGVPGAHNALNATACLIAAARCQLDITEAAAALGSFRGAERRFETKGEAQGITVIDDYAHHPTEIAATLAAARARFGSRRIWAVMQPHTYSRTETLLDELSVCFCDADHVIITPIYAARAKEHKTITSTDLAAAIEHDSVTHMDGFAHIAEHLAEEMQSGDVLITMGAGDGYLIGEQLLELLS